MAKEKPFNNPFAALKQRQEEEAKAKAQVEPGKAAPAPKAAPPQGNSKGAWRDKSKLRGQLSEADEQALFLASVGEVAPVRVHEKGEAKPTANVAQNKSADDEALLQLTELAYKADTLVADYSKGMRRRVAIAAAVILNVVFW